MTSEVPPIEIRVHLLEDRVKENRENMHSLDEKLDALEASIQKLTYTIMGAMASLTVGVLLWMVANGSGIGIGL